MSSTSHGDGSGEITVHYWASARAAAGVVSDVLAVDGPTSVSRLRELALELHPDTDLGRVLAVCSVLVGERPIGTADPAEVMVSPGSVVEFLPPFAGG